MQASTNSSSYKVKENLLIKGYEKLNFIDLIENEKYQNSDLYIERNNDLEYSEIELLTNKPIHSLASNVYTYSVSELTNFEIIRKNCHLKMLVPVFVDNKDGSKSMTLESLLEEFSKDSSRRKHIYNCVNIDFTFMNLGKIFKPIDFVIKNDIVINNWPDIYKIAQLYHVNKCGEVDNLIVPLTHQVCSISGKGSFTDFHIDFSGASVWVMLLKGKKIWWLIPPTPYNVRLYEQHLKDHSSCRQNIIELAEQCCRITLTEGQSLLVPSGWMHAVLTLEDSLMIGCSFLTLYGMDVSFKIVESENRQRMIDDYKYPYYYQIIWYLINNFVEKIYGQSYIDKKQYKKMDILKNSIFKRNRIFPSNYFENMSSYIMNKDILNLSNENEYFTSKLFHGLFDENLIKKEEANKLTEDEVKIFLKLSKFVETEELRVMRNIPQEITDSKNLLEIFQSIISFISEERNIIEEVPINDHPTRTEILIKKAVPMRLGKLAEKKRKATYFVNNVRSKRKH
uniref:JmjC domain-containing protein n=1 Tax=Strongyloides venezuelensis TaxID=75913 RepID=A0A0K0EX85_STRVS